MYIYIYIYISLSLPLSLSLYIYIYIYIYIHSRRQSGGRAWCQNAKTPKQETENGRNGRDTKAKIGGHSRRVRSNGSEVKPQQKYITNTYYVLTKISETAFRTFTSSIIINSIIIIITIMIYARLRSVCLLLLPSLLIVVKKPPLASPTCISLSLYIYIYI